MGERPNGFGVRLRELREAAGLTQEALAERALVDERPIGNDWGVAMALGGLGEIARARGDLERAAACFSGAAAATLAHHDYWHSARPLVGPGLVAAMRGEAARAARILGAAEAVYEVTGDSMHRRWGGRGYDKAVAAIRAALGEEAFAAAWAAGRMLPVGEAVEVALRRQLEGGSGPK